MDMSHDHAHHAPGSHLGYMCDGTHWTGMAYQRPSNWSTHVMPGVILTLWSLHWTFGVFKGYLTSSRTHPYRARTTFDFPFIPASWPVEGVLKILIPFFSIMAQLWWSHGHWSRRVCEPGSLRAEHLSITAVHNWQNAWTLFAFMVAGVVDVTTRYLTLPANLQHFMTTLAFALQSFGLYQGVHQDMLDLMVYYLLFMAVGATALVMTAEIAWPEPFFLGVLKAYTMWLQAVWYFTTARVLFEGRPAWDTLQPMPDMSPEMFVPVVFVMLMNMVALSMLLGFLFMRWWYEAHLNEHLRASCSVERTLVMVSGGASAHPREGQARMSSRLWCQEGCDTALASRVTLLSLMSLTWSRLSCYSCVAPGVTPLSLLCHSWATCPLVPQGARVFVPPCRHCPEISCVTVAQLIRVWLPLLIVCMPLCTLFPAVCD